MQVEGTGLHHLFSCATGAGAPPPCSEVLARLAQVLPESQSSESLDTPPTRRREDCHSAASPSTFSSCFNRDGERASAK